jgi:septal ring factor EnvC (AmiA/AmiB activator)
MVTVYMLGHRVGDIEEPVLYVNHKSYNYDGVEVTKGIPDPFVDSLVHDSIIVQIPLLRGTINNRLDKVLSVFDQSHKDKYNQQVLNFDDNAFEDDVEMRHILHRLLAAASDAKLRQDMNVEDEYFSAIEDRDTAIMLRDKKIAERDAKLAEQDSKLAEQDSKLAEQDSKLAEQNSKLAEQGAQLAEQGTQLAERDAKLAEQGTQLAEKEAQLAEKDKALLSSAKALKQTGLSVKQIAAMTKLSEDTISLL